MQNGYLTPVTRIRSLITLINKIRVRSRRSQHSEEIEGMCDEVTTLLVQEMADAARRRE